MGVLVSKFGKSDRLDISIDATETGKVEVFEDVGLYNNYLLKTDVRFT